MSLLTTKQKEQHKYTTEELETLQRMKEAVPNWYAILYEDKLDTWHNINEYTSCIVGEWHGHDR